MEEKIIKDAVHGHMSFHPLLIAIIDTPQFQRLRDIKQLGFVYNVYPSASHNRFEHSLGTCHLAGLFLDALKKANAPHNDQEKLAVQVAALCHDLGHGPFSHTWEKFLHTYDMFSNWQHEDTSVKIFEMILLEQVKGKNSETIRELFFEYNLTEDYIILITNIIKGKTEDIRPERHYLCEIVSNKGNGVDVDKWDYLMRDSKWLGVPIAFDTMRLFHISKVLEYNGRHHICFRDKELRVIVEMFKTRATLHEIAYQHEKVVIIEKMFIDAMKLVTTERPTFYPNLLPNDVQQFIKLTDYIFFKILCAPDSEYKKTRSLLHRILRRDFYQYVTKINIPLTLQSLDNISAECFVKLAMQLTNNNNSSIQCQETDFEVIPIKITLGDNFQHGKEPNGIYLFTKNEPDIAIPISLKHLGKADVLEIMNNYPKKEFILVYKGPKRLSKDCVALIAKECDLRLQAAKISYESRSSPLKNSS